MVNIYKFYFEIATTTMSSRSGIIICIAVSLMLVNLRSVHSLLGLGSSSQCCQEPNRGGEGEEIENNKKFKFSRHCQWTKSL